MKTSSPSSPLPRQPRAVLLIGPPGSGKTTLMMQFPKLRIIDCDQNLAGPEKHIRKFNKELSYGYDIATQNATGQTALDHECWDRLLTIIDDIRIDKESQTIGCDGLTPINEFLIRKVLKDQGSKTLMEPHFWGPFKSQMLGLMFGKFRSLNRDIILTCHESITTKSKGGKADFMVEEIINRKPTVNGGIGDYFSGFFTDVWRCELKPVPGPVGTFEPWITTVRSSVDDLKNSMGMPGTMRARWEDIKPYWEGTK